MRLNTPKASIRTHEGAVVSHLSPEERLRRSVTACLLWEGTFYEGGEVVGERIAKLVPQVPAERVAAMAVRAREEDKLRHVPLLLCCEMAKHESHRGQVEETVARVIQRPDELTEILAIYSHGRQGAKKLGKLSKALQRGIARAFQKFDTYQLAKYDRKGEVRLRDALFLSHAKPRDEAQAQVWRDLIDGKLAAPDTWEVSLSGGADKCETWERLIAERKLGGLALLRNLRNMMQAGVPLETIRSAIASNPFRRVLPFRFLAAARYAPALEPELEQAMFRALGEVERLPGRTVVIVDNSDSMHWALSAKSEMQRVDAACGMAILAREMCEDVRVIGFGSECAEIPPRRGFALRDAILRGPGGGTYTGKAVCLAESMGYDRCLVVTDGQSHDRVSSPTGLGYILNLASYDRGIGYGPWTVINGWSESVLRYIAADAA